MIICIQHHIDTQLLISLVSKLLGRRTRLYRVVRMTYPGKYSDHRKGIIRPSRQKHPKKCLKYYNYSLYWLNTCLLFIFFFLTVAQNKLLFPERRKLAALEISVKYAILSQCLYRSQIFTCVTYYNSACLPSLLGKKIKSLVQRKLHSKLMSSQEMRNL